jgi:putative thioredoxin
MSQQPFTRPGAVDLSGLKRPAAPAEGGPPAGASNGSGSYTVNVTTENFQSVLEQSMTAPVLLVVHSPSRSPESTTYADDVAGVVEQYEGRFLAALVDLDANPQIGQALQVTQVPLLLVLLDGRPATQPIPGVLAADEVSTLLQQLGQQLTAQGVSGRHQPRTAVGAGDDEDVDPLADPRYAAAQDALARDDVDGAVAEYQKLVDANPADAEAAAGLAMAKVLQRAHGVDAPAALAAADASPDDVEAQTLAADLDLLAGRVDEAFARLVEVVRRTADADRTRAREHLLGLFAAVGTDDPRVLKGRQSLASALF